MILPLVLISTAYTLALALNVTAETTLAPVILPPEPDVVKLAPVIVPVAVTFVPSVMKPLLPNNWPFTPLKTICVLLKLPS